MGMERRGEEDILLELSNRSLDLALSLEWSTNPWE